MLLIRAALSAVGVALLAPLLGAQGGVTSDLGRPETPLTTVPGPTQPATASGQTGPAGQAVGPDAGAGHGRWSVHLGLFEVDDSGGAAGNPFLDESLTVIEPVVLYEYNASDVRSYWAQFSYDNVSSASIERLNAFPDQSGASGDYYFGLDGGLNHRMNRDLTLGGHAHASVEYDYLSVGLGGSATVESDDRNSAWTYTLDTYFDQLDLILFDGTEPGTDDRVSVSGGASWYRVLSPSAHGQLGFTAGYQTGFLATPYNAVVVEDPTQPPNPNLANNARGLEFTEVVPDERLRLSLHGRARTRVGPSTAIELGGRVYDDDWGIQSFAIEPRIYQALTDDVRMSLRLRYYDQSEADFFQESFTAATPLRTQDSDLGAFDSQTIGLSLTWDLNERTALDFGLDMISRSDDLDQLAFFVGWRRDF